MTKFDEYSFEPKGGKFVVTNARGEEKVYDSSEQALQQLGKEIIKDDKR